MRPKELDRLRMRGIDILVPASWAITGLFLLYGVLAERENVWIVVAIGAVANLLPTYMLVRRRFDVNARLIVGTLGAI